MYATLTMEFSPTFVLLQQEAYLAKGSLSIGLTALRNAVLPDKATFYTGFFNTSIAFERIMKLIVVIDHMLQHNGKPPNTTKLRSYGHNLQSLYSSCVDTGHRNGLLVTPPTASSLEEKILKFLSEFNTTSRYYNLDALLVVPSSYNEPLSVWDSILDLVLVNDVPQKKMYRCMMQAQITHELIADYITAVQHGMNGKLLSVPEVFSVPAKHELTAPYAMVHIFNLLNPLLQIAATVGRLAFYGPPTRSTPLAPLLNEFFVHFSGSDAEIRRKKRW